MNRYSVDPAAQADLDEIWDYIAVTNGNPQAARKLMKSFRDTFVLLGNHPRFGAARDDLSPGIRLFPVGGYLVIFRPTDEGATIVQVVHGSRDLIQSDSSY